MMDDKIAGEEERKELHNFVQHLKGPMRVYCRVKPLQMLYPMETSNDQTPRSSFMG